MYDGEPEASPGEHVAESPARRPEVARGNVAFEQIWKSRADVLVVSSSRSTEKDRHIYFHPRSRWQWTLNGHTRHVVCAVHFYATESDESALLDHIGVPAAARIFRWVPMSRDDPAFIEREDLGASSQVGILRPDLGGVEIIDSESSHDSSFKARVFNQLNWDRQQPGRGEGIIDWNRTPALFWVRGSSEGEELHRSTLGSQADAMDRISDDYRRWVNSMMGWVRRRGLVVWQWTRDGGQSDFDVRLSIANTIYALPEAAARLEDGARGR